MGQAYNNTAQRVQLFLYPVYIPATSCGRVGKQEGLDYFSGLSHGLASFFVFKERGTVQKLSGLVDHIARIMMNQGQWSERWPRNLVCGLGGCYFFPGPRRSGPHRRTTSSSLDPQRD